ncbi:olfactory receptor 5AN1-like [Hypomesus transpacificus]|uniref:olfactory receptor 5AN1-like n=1 Tax=Hypomesus transpacificus TaxID=137520 RepID=UPI001F0796E7|nr:olfactory receptor 5AN1-like [Hypomesus transpacificus]
MNSTQVPVAYFIIQGLDSLGDIQTALFVIFLVAYIIILGGNSMIIFLVRTDPKLNSPMYFFLHNLSFVDIVYASVTFPSLLSGFLTENKTTSVPACFLQMYFYIQMGVTGRGLLTVMAYDRYVAICDPLRYTATMTGTVRVLLVLGAWTFAAGCTLPAVTMATQRFYCGPNVVFHLWCDPSSVRVLVCGNTSMDSLVSLSSALVALIGTAVLILASYVMIGVAVAKMAAAQRWKAFTTCAAHLTVVLLSYITAFFVYISYRVGNLSPEVRMIVAMSYSAMTPLLNPIIYSLRNKELRDAVRRSLCRLRTVTPKSFRTLNTLS